MVELSYKFTILILFLLKFLFKRTAFSVKLCDSIIQFIIAPLFFLQLICVSTSSPHMVTDSGPFRLDFVPDY